MNIGELFISLGFDVDDKKLKDFNQNIREAQNGLVSIGTTAAIAASALGKFISAQSENAIKLRNATAELGINARAMQGFANVAHQLNPSISMDSYLDNYKRFSQIVKQNIALGNGPSGTLALLLGESWRPGMSEEEMIELIRGNKKNVVKQFGTANFSSFLDQVGLGAGSTQTFDLSKNRYDQMVKEVEISQRALDNLSEFGLVTGRLAVVLNTFTSDLAGSLPIMAKGIKSFTDALIGWDKFNQNHPNVSAAEAVAAGVGGGAAGWFGIKKLLQLFKGGGSAAGGASEGALSAVETAEAQWAAATATGVSGAAVSAILALSAGAIWGSSWAGKKLGEHIRANSPSYNNPGNMREPGATSGFQTFPTAMSGLKAMARQLQLYAGRGKDTLSSIVGTYAPADDGNNVLAYIADLVKQTGFSPEQHLSHNGAIDPHTLATLMHAMIKHEKGKDNYGDDVDRAAGLTMTVTQNIHSTAPLDQTIADVNRGNQASLNTTALQLNNGPHQ